MNIIQSLILGIVQGVTEFLPISSSGHLILAPKIFGWADQGLSFTVALHWGTLFGVVGYFYKDWIRMFHSSLRGVPTLWRNDAAISREEHHDDPRKKYGIASVAKLSRNDSKILWFIIIATIPGAIAGYFLEGMAETIFRSSTLVALTLIIAGLVLYFADVIGKKNRNVRDIGFKIALVIGLAQMLAIIPGVSRSGITISMALFLGLKRKDAARFSFLLATPIILGAGLIKIPDIISSGINMAFVVGFLASGISGFLAVKWLLKYVEGRSYLAFVIYRIILGAGILFFL